MTLRAPTFWNAEDQMQQRPVRWQGGHRCSSASPGVFHGRVSSLPSQSSPGLLPGSSAWPLGTWGDAGAPVQAGFQELPSSPCMQPLSQRSLVPPVGQAERLHRQGWRRRFSASSFLPPHLCHRDSGRMQLSSVWDASASTGLFYSCQSTA